MSLNFSIDSILRHGNVETNPNSTLIGSGLTGLNKLNQTSFLDESTSTFFKRQQQQLNYLNNNMKNSNTNGTSSSTNSQIINSNQLNETGNSNFLQSQLFYLNNLSQLSNLNKQNLIDDLAINGINETSNSTSTNAFANLELNHLNPVLQSHLNQFHNQFQNQLNRYNYFNKLYNNNNNNHLSSSNSFKHNQNELLSKQRISLNDNGNASMISGKGSESQCSPLSDKSSEMLLNYDSSESQLSGNNVSINSKSSFKSNQLSLKSMRDKDKNKDVPLCQKCKLHGIRNQVKGHKKNCPKKDCPCELCNLTDNGKRLRGKKGQKNVATQLTSAGLATGLSQLKNLGTLNGNIKSLSLPPIPPASINGQQAASLLMNMNNLNDKQLTTLNNDSGLLAGLQSSTPNSNSNSSCSNISMSTAALASLNKHDLQLPSTNNLNNLNNLNQATAALTNEQIGFLEKSTIKDYMKMVINILKEKLAQDGLNYEKELSKLKFAVIYLLLNRFEDKSELYNKFIMES